MIIDQINPGQGNIAAADTKRFAVAILVLNNKYNGNYKYN